MQKTEVTWLPWSKESFSKAKMLDKPILLGISAVWCHWCHVMDKTTYSNSKVASLIEDLFIPIRVDRDQRPDIDKRYNMGGWPSTTFLTPDGDILTGATYIPPQEMIVLLNHVSRTYQKEKDTLKTHIKQQKQEIKKPADKSRIDTNVFRSIIDNLTLTIASQFDAVHGGFGTAPKFPHSGVLRLSLLQYKLHKYKAALTIVKKTLASMNFGGIYDKEEGGFFRYSTTRDWSIPHYEKMCEDNANLLINYLEAYQVTGEKIFSETAKGILKYVNDKLRNRENAGFYGSQDADEVYYKLDLSERKNRTEPRIDQTIFVNWNAKMVSAYVLATIVLEESFYKKFALDTVQLLLKTAFNPDKGMNHYIIDSESYLPGLLTDQVYMVKCLIDCYQITLDKKLLDKAEKLAEIMLARLWDLSGGFNDKTEENEDFGALKIFNKPLEENSAAIDVFLRLYHLTAKQQYLDTARKTLEFFSSNYQRYGILAANYGLAIEFYLNPLQIHIIGSRKEKLTFRFLTESLKIYSPLKTVEVVDPEQDKDKLKNLGYPIADLPMAYVCSEGTCKVARSPKNIPEIIESETNANRK